MKCRIYTILLLLAGFQLATAQEHINLNPDKILSQYMLKNWNSSSGMQGNDVQALIQSSEGYIWIGNYSGLSRFDGLNFKHYTSREVPQMLSETVQAIAETADSTIWIATVSGVFAYKNFEFFKPPVFSLLDSKNSEIMLGDSRGNLWIGINGEGVYFYDQDSVFQIDELKPLEKSTITVLFEDRDSIIWIGTNEGELYKFQNKLKLMLQPKQTDGVNAIYQTKNGQMLVATGSGLFVKENDGFAKLKILENQVVADIIVDQHGDYWIGSLQGLFRYSPQTKKLQLLDESKGLPNNMITKIMVDQEGNFWGGTYRNGLFRLSGGRFLCYSVAEGLHSNLLTSVAQFDAKTYVLGFEEGSVALFRNDSLFDLKTNIPLPNGRLKHVMVDSRQRIWISTYAGLLVVDDGKSTLYNENNGFGDKLVRMAFEDKEGNIWIGTKRTGLHRLDKLGNVQSYNQENGLSSNYIMDIEQGHDGRILVSTKHGFNIIDDRKVQKSYFVEDGVTSNFSFAVHPEKNGNYWLCSNDGIHLIQQDGQIFNFSTKSGLVDNSVFDIVEDSLGYFWMPTAKGIMRINKQEIYDFSQGKITQLKPELLGKADGMKNSECIGATEVLKDNQGLLWFYTMGGLAVINPYEKPESCTPPNTLIEQIIIDNKTQGTSKYIEMKPENKRIQIRYTALNFKAPERIRFKYRLTPFEKQWNDVDNDRVAAYTSMRPGTYHFELMAADGKGDWQETTKTLTIEVKPPIYQTWWFRGLSVVVVFLIAYAFYRNRLNTIKNRNAILEARVKERTAEVEQQNEEIMAQKDALEEKGNQIEIQNDHIKGSIRYAKTIQQAILPLKQLTDTHYKTALLFRPKDIVSGDFYWFTHIESKNYTFYAVLDCTGHGVPGAFMSLIGNRLIGEIVNERKIFKPSKILTALDKMVYKALRQDITDNTDGMDVSLLRLEKGNNGVKAVYSGAKRPLIMYSKAEKQIVVHRGNRKSIGGKKRKSALIDFTDLHINLQKDDYIYLTSDGYIDQNNRERKRFGTPQLLEYLAQNANKTLEQQILALEQNLDNWQNGEEQRDDITIWTIKV